MRGKTSGARRCFTKLHWLTERGQRWPWAPRAASPNCVFARSRGSGSGRTERLFRMQGGGGFRCGGPGGGAERGGGGDGQAGQCQQHEVDDVAGSEGAAERGDVASRAGARFEVDVVAVDGQTGGGPAEGLPAGEQRGRWVGVNNSPAIRAVTGLPLTLTVRRSSTFRPVEA